MEFVAVIVTLKVPEFVGVPVMTPVCEFSVKPPGRPVASKPIATPVACIAKLKGVFIRPSAVFRAGDYRQGHLHRESKIAIANPAPIGGGE